MAAKKRYIRPSVRLTEFEHRQIEHRLDELGMTFQEYIMMLICKDIDWTKEELDYVNNKLALFSKDE